jgi:hypothetical protein
MRVPYRRTILRIYFSILSGYMAPLADVSFDETKREVDEKKVGESID